MDIKVWPSKKPKYQHRWWFGDLWFIMYKILEHYLKMHVEKVLQNNLD